MDDFSDNIDLAPQRVRRSLNTLFSGTQALLPVQPRERDIIWEDYMKDTKLTVLEVCGNKIIAGFDDGQVNIYNSVDLNCEKSLPYYQQNGSVQCLQCSCTEIIAGYRDGNICSWNIQSGLQTRKMSLRTFESSHLSSTRYPTCMWREAPKLVVGTTDGKIVIFQHVNSNFTTLGAWNVGEHLKKVYFDEKYVIVFGNSVRVYNWNGKLVRTILSWSSQSCMMYSIRDMTYLEGNIIIIGAAGVETVASVMNVKTEEIVHELQGHINGSILAVDAFNNCVLTTDTTGSIILWTLEAAQNRNLQAAARFPSPECPSKSLGPNPHVKVCWLRLGQTFFVRHFSCSSKIVVTDFP